MINLGPTGDMIVAGLLAVSQLITPISENAAQKAEQELQSQNPCQAVANHKAEFNRKNCEGMREDRREYREKCQGLETSIESEEVQCATAGEVHKVLHFKPKTLAQYMSLPNDKLVEELHTLCNVVQDRVFLDPADWKVGKMANRDDIASKLVILEKPELQSTVSEILKEAHDGEFVVGDAAKAITAICHWKVDRKEVAKQIDFTSGYKYLNQLLDELPNIDVLPDLPQASFVYDTKGRRIGEIFDKEFVSRHGKRYIGQMHRRRVVTPDEVPDMLYNAFIAIEDKRFREHNGFDFEAVKRLIYGGAQGTKEGGSTFTMQLLKNVFFDEDLQTEREAGKRTLRRKIKEILTLPKIEARYSKNEILAYYLNLINLTPNAQGVRMASIDLFDKTDLKQLTVPEMALLAAMPKGASLYNPRRFPEQARARRDLVLKAMNDQKYISDADLTKFLEEPIVLSDPKKEEDARVLSRFFMGHLSNHFFSLKKKNLRDPRWTMGGFDIQTGLDLDLQEIVIKSLQKGLLAYEKGTGRYKWKPWLDESTNKNLNVRDRAKGDVRNLMPVLQALHPAHPYPETDWLIAAKVKSGWMLEDGKIVNVEGGGRFKDFDVAVVEQTEKSYKLASGTEVQGAAIMMDITTGNVLAMSGGFSSGPFGRFAQNNRATMAMRQPGSTVKPFIYLYALNKGISENQILSTSPIRFPKIPGCPFQWAPGNYGGGHGTGGQLPLKTALQKSVNRSVLSLFLNVAGIPYNKSGGSDFSGASSEIVDKIYTNFLSVYDFASDFGAFPTREQLKAVGYKGPCLPFLLGSQETTPLRMAQAYASFGNGGLKREAVFLREVLKDRQPLVVDESASRQAQVEQYRTALRRGWAHAPEAFGAIGSVKPSAVATVRRIMQGVLSDGTATRIKRWSELIAGKTGTTNDSKDVWFVGFNNRVAVAVWIGYDDTETYKNLGSSTGGSTALPIFESIMEGYYALHPDALNEPLPKENLK